MLELVTVGVTWCVLFVTSKNKHTGAVVQIPAEPGPCVKVYDPAPEESVIVPRLS